MLTQGRKYFRFHFLAFPLLLLLSPTQARMNLKLDLKLELKLKGCAEIASAPMENLEVASLVQDPKSLTNLVDCFQGMYHLIQEDAWKTVQDEMPKGVQGLLQKIPNLMEKAKPSTASRGGLVLLSVYLGYRSIELYDRATKLKIDVKKYRQEFDLLKEELKPIKEFLDTEIVPQWKKGNITIVPKNTDKLTEMLSRYSDELKKLVEVIYNDVKQGSSNRIWSASYGITFVGVCAVSFFSRNPGVIVVVCGIGFGIAIINFQSFISLGEALEKLDLLWNDAAQFRTEITKYRSILEVLKLRGDFY